MPTLGEELKRLREERGITLSEIAESTRIGTRFLKAIEEGNFSTLPGGIFTRSFIRAYAKKVGMNEDEAVTLYHEQTTEKDAVPPGSSASAPEFREEASPVIAQANPEPMFAQNARPAGRSALYFLVAAALIAIAVIAVLMLKRSGDQDATQPSALSSAKAQKPGQGAGDQAQQSMQSNTSISIAPGQPIDITLEATNGASWVRYQVDEGQFATLVLQPGESKVLPPAHDEIKLHLGNRTTLRLKIDNHDATFPAGTPNFAAQVTISHDNLHQFIAQ
ncbi:MAG TPA: helix-turn-helix transcriptional regulator [Blastocatellia bacterium]